MPGRAALAALALAGCAVLPPPPAGPPLAPGSVAYGLTWGLAGGPAEAELVDAAGTRHELRGNGDLIGGGLDLGGILASPRLSLGFAPRPDLALGVHAGGWDAGVRARLFLAGPARAGVPLALSAGAQVGYRLFRDRPSPGTPFEARVGLEAYPYMPAFGPSLLAVDVSAGPRRHALPLPSALAPPEGEGPTFGRPDLEILRPEVRVDLTLGTILYRGDRPVGVVALAPYLVLHAGASRAACACAAPVRLARFEQIGGVALMLGPLTHLATRRP